MSTPSIHRPSPLPAAVPDRLWATAWALAETAAAVPGPTALVGLVDLAGNDLAEVPGAPPDAIGVTALVGPDPVAMLVGLHTPADRWAVGLVSAARSRRLQDGDEAGSGAFVHLVARDGTAITVFADDLGPEIVEGPSADPQTGRVPDLCRRVLGLPTPPPPCGLAPHLVDLWLADLVRAAVEEPAITWAEAASLHPAVGGEPPGRHAPPPAELVRSIAELDDPAHWETYRLACARKGRAPGAGLDRAALEWLDTGSFARWLLGEAAPRPLMLEHLDAVLPRATADKVFATVRLSPAPAWPPSP